MNVRPSRIFHYYHISSRFDGGQCSWYSYQSRDNHYKYETFKS